MSETPFEQAKRLQLEGATAEQVVKALVDQGLPEDEAAIAARAARGESGLAAAVVPAPPPPEAPPEAPPAHPCPKHAQWPVRGTCERCGAFFCTRCLREAGRSGDSRRCPACLEKPTAQPIGGWLTFPALGLIVTPLMLGFGIFQGLQALSSELAPGVALPVVIELLVNVALMGFGLFCAVAFFRKQRRAVPLMIGFYAAGLAVLVLDLLIGSWVRSLVGGDEDALSPSTARGAITSVVWMAYFSKSRRVRDTFVYD